MAKKRVNFKQREEILKEAEFLANSGRSLHLVVMFQLAQYSKFVLRESLLSSKEYNKIKSLLKKRLPQIDKQYLECINLADLESNRCSLKVETEKEKWEGGKHFFTNCQTLLEELKERSEIVGSITRW